MIDGLDQFMRPIGAPVSDTNQTNIWTQYTYDNQIGPVNLASGRMNGQIYIGGQGTTSGYIRLDGANNRILSNYGTNNRIIIGSI